MNVAWSGRTRWVVIVASIAGAGGLVLTGARSGDGQRASYGGTAPAVATATPGAGTDAGAGTTAPGDLTGTAAPGTGTETAAPGGGGIGSAAPGGTETPVSGASTTPAADGPYAGRSRVFGLVKAGPTPETVRFAPARKVRHGGPETVRPVDVGRYVTLHLAPGAVIRASAPIANEGVTDWVRGIRLTPERFRVLMRRLQARSHPLLDRAHMFELWFDRRGRITRMQHYFSP